MATTIKFSELNKIITQQIETPFFTFKKLDGALLGFQTIAEQIMQDYIQQSQQNHSLITLLKDLQQVNKLVSVSDANAVIKQNFNDFVADYDCIQHFMENRYLQICKDEDMIDIRTDDNCQTEAVEVEGGIVQQLAILNSYCFEHNHSMEEYVAKYLRNHQKSGYARAIDVYTVSSINMCLIDSITHAFKMFFTNITDEQLFGAQQECN